MAVVVPVLVAADIVFEGGAGAATVAAITSAGFGADGIAAGSTAASMMAAGAAANGGATAAASTVAVCQSIGATAAGTAAGAGAASSGTVAGVVAAGTGTATVAGGAVGVHHYLASKHTAAAVVHGTKLIAKAGLAIAAVAAALVVKHGSVKGAVKALGLS